MAVAVVVTVPPALCRIAEHLGPRSERTLPISQPGEQPGGENVNAAPIDELSISTPFIVGDQYWWRGVSQMRIAIRTRRNVTRCTRQQVRP